MEMTRRRLDGYRKTMDNIRALKVEIEEWDTTDKGIGHTVILDYQTGSPRPQAVIGFDWDKYKRKKQELSRLQKEADDIKHWIEGIEDGQTRWVFQMRYIQGMSWARIAKKMGKSYNADYPRLYIRDKYLKTMDIK